MTTVSLVPILARKVAEAAPVRIGSDTIPLPAGETPRLLKTCGCHFKSLVRKSVVIFENFALLVNIAQSTRALKALAPATPSTGIKEFARVRRIRPRGPRLQNTSMQVVVSFAARDATTARSSFFSLTRIIKPSVE